MRSRCTELWFIYLLATLLVLPFSVYSAPSENRKFNNGANGEKENVFMQSSPTNSDNDEGDKVWYPTIDMSKDSDNGDYETDNAAKKQPPEASPVKAKITKITITESKKSSPETKGKSDFKTFCEDGSKGNCSSSKSKPKKQIMLNEKATGQSCEQIIGQMRNITGNKDKIEKDEMTKLRELIESLSKVMKCDANASNTKSLSVILGVDTSKNLKPRGPIEEIEQKRIIERKIIQAKDHKEKQEITNVVDTVMENTEGPLETTTIPSTKPPVPPPSNLKKNTQSEINYLALPADVNYNGGINRHMDDLKRMYPKGHWPDQDGDREEGLSRKQKQELDAEYEEGYITEDYDEKEEEEENQDIRKFKDKLTPEYLEMIIQNERVSSPKKSNNEMNSFHHVQEHKLPIRK